MQKVYQKLEKGVEFDLETFIEQTTDLDTPVLTDHEKQLFLRYLKDKYIGIPENQPCSVCMGEFELNEDIVQFPICKHRYHWECLEIWLNSKVTCPMCRQPVRSNLMRHIYRVNRGIEMGERAGEVHEEVTESDFFVDDGDGVEGGMTGFEDGREQGDGLRGEDGYQELREVLLDGSEGDDREFGGVHDFGDTGDDGDHKALNLSREDVVVAGDRSLTGLERFNEGLEDSLKEDLIPEEDLELSDS